MADCEMSSMAPGFQYPVPHGDAVREITEPLTPLLQTTGVDLEGIALLCFWFPFCPLVLEDV